MKKSRILSALNRRPLLPLAAIVLLLCLCYVNLVYVPPQVTSSSSETVMLTGYLEDISFDSEGKIKSFQLLNCYVEKRPGYSKGLHVLCYVNGLDSLPPVGSKVRIKGQLSQFESATNPGEFDGKAYYQNRHILYAVKNTRIEAFSEPKYPIFDRLFKIRTLFANKIASCCPLEYGTINTILWADKSNLPKERKDLYKEVGLAHFLVISGLHIQALGSGFYMLLRKINLKRSLAAFLGILVIVSYGLLVGFQISIFRAVIMFSLRLFADILKKPYDMLSAMSLSLIMTLFIDPFYCMDTGFIYSYSCLLCLSLYMEIIRIQKKRPPLALIMWLFLLPLTLTFSYKVSFVSVFLNIVLGIFTLPLLAISFLAFISSLHNFSFVASVADFLFALIIRFMDKICQFAHEWHFLSLEGKPALWKVLVYIMILVLFIMLLQNRVSPLGEILTYLGLVAFLTANLSFAPYFTMLNIGQGDCMVLTLSPGKALIFDAGSSSKKNISKNIIVPYLNYSGIYEIQAIFLSHSDKDHTNAVADLIEECAFEGIKIRSLIISDFSYREMDEEMKTISDKAISSNINIQLFHAGQKKEFGNRFDNKVSLTCLWPNQNDDNSSSSNSDTDKNYQSLVMLLSYKSFDIMLTGDMTDQSEKLILDAATAALAHTTDKKLEVLKVAHHGSRHSSTMEFLEEVKPEYSIISVGLHNSYGHPNAETLSRLKKVNSKIYRTDLNGAISFRLR